MPEVRATAPAPRAEPPPLSAIGENDPDMTIFQQPWWLEAVSDNRYRAVTAGDGIKTFLWWPYTEERWWGFNLLCAPAMTHTLGPVIRLPEGKAVSRASLRRRLIETALDKLPRADGITQVLDPGSPHAQDFGLAGFEISVRYTYRLDTSAPIPVLWDSLKDKVRNNIRLGRASFATHTDMSVMDFCALYEANLGRAGRINHHDEGVYRRLNEALAHRDRHRIIVATDRTTGQTVAATMVVWDANTLYYLRATQDGTPNARGAASLLAWEAIELASTMGLAFDSDTYFGRTGAMFIEAFGAEPVERLVINRKTTALKVAQALGRRLPGALKASV